MTIIIIAILTVVLLFMCLSTVALIIVNVFLVRGKARLQEELARVKELSVYEEVELPPLPIPPATISTTDNLAYSSVSQNK